MSGSDGHLLHMQSIVEPVKADEPDDGFAVESNEKQPRLLRVHEPLNVRSGSIGDQAHVEPAEELPRRYLQQGQLLHLLTGCGSDRRLLRHTRQPTTTAGGGEPCASVHGGVRLPRCRPQEEGAATEASSPPGVRVPPSPA